MNSSCKVASLFNTGDTEGSHSDFRQNIQHGGSGIESPELWPNDKENLLHITSHRYGSDAKSNHTCSSVSSTIFRQESRDITPVNSPTALDNTTPTEDEGYESLIETDRLLYDISTDFHRYKNYEDVIYHSNLQYNSSFDFSYPANELGSQMNIPGWRHELFLENDIILRNYLSFGIENGFFIVNCTIPSYECSNNSSVLTGAAFECVDSIIKKELSCGKYIIANSKPHCVHS